jgi:hypothetical protein
VRTALVVRHGRLRLLVDVTLPSPPFPRSGIAINHLHDLATDEELTAGLWGTPASAAIRRKVERAGARYKGRYAPGVVRELRALEREAPDPELRELAGAARQVLRTGGLATGQAERFLLIRKAASEDVGRDEPAVSLFQAGRDRDAGRAYVVLRPSGLELFPRAGGQLEIDHTRRGQAVCWLWATPAELSRDSLRRLARLLRGRGWHVEHRR